MSTGDVPLLPSGPGAVASDAPVTTSTATTTPPTRKKHTRWSRIALLVGMPLLCVGAIVGGTLGALAAAGHEAKKEFYSYWPFETKDEDDDDAEDSFEKLNHEIMQLTPDQAHARMPTWGSNSDGA